MSVAFQDSNHSAPVSLWVTGLLAIRRRAVPAASVMLGLLVLGALIYFSKVRDTQPLTYYGVVESQEIRLASKVGGRISEVLVSEGDYVEAGTPIVRFDAPELAAEERQCLAQLHGIEARLSQARNGALPEQIVAAEAALDAAKANLADLEAGHRDQEIAQAELDVDVLKSEAERASAEHQRLKNLFTDRIISASEYDSGRTLMLSANGRLEIAKQQLSQLQAGSRKDVIAQAQSTVRKMQAELDYIKRGTREEEIQQLSAQVEEAQARLDLIRTRLFETTVIAPDACLIEVLSVRAGQILAPNEPVVKVRGVQDHWIKAFVPETDLHRFEMHGAVSLARDNDSKQYTGRVVHISSVSEFTPRNIQSINERQHQVFAVKVKPDTNFDVFKSGMAARVLVPKHKTQTVPQTRPTDVDQSSVPHGIPVSSDRRRPPSKEPDAAW